VDGGNDGSRLFCVMEGPVVEGTVGFDVVHRGAHSVRHPIQRAQLVQDIPEQLVKGRVQKAPPKAREVPVADVGTNGHVQFECCPAAVQHGDRVAGVKAAGHVGTGDELEHGGIITHAP
jgi:hypothetical protein